MFETIEEALRLMSVGELKDFLKSFNGFNMNAISAKSKIIPQFLEYVRTTRTITFQSSPTKQNIESDVLKRFGFAIINYQNNLYQFIILD